MNHKKKYLKNYKLLLILLVVLIAISAYLFLKPNGPGYSVNAINATLTVNENRTVSGIYRIFYKFYSGKSTVDLFFPTSFKVGSRQVRAKIYINAVSDELGNKLKYRQGFAFGGTKLRIYSPGSGFENDRQFNIEFTTDPIIRRMAGRDLLIWNVTGGKWRTQVNNAKIEVVSPSAMIDGVNENYQVFSKEDIQPGKDLALEVRFGPGSGFKDRHWLVWLLQLSSDYINYLLLLVIAVFALSIYKRSGKRLRLSIK